MFSLAFGRNLDAHDPPEASNVALNGTQPLTRAGLPSASAHQCLDGRDCYVASLHLTLVACVIALGLAIWAGRRDWKDRQERQERGERMNEVVWEGAGEVAGAED